MYFLVVLSSTYQSNIFGDNNPSANPRMSAVVRELDGVTAVAMQNGMKTVFLFEIVWAYSYEAYFCFHTVADV